MKKLIYSLVALMALSTTMVKAQETGFGWGVKAGVNIANVSNSEGKSKMGFVGGLFADYRTCNWFGVSADILYSGQGVKSKDIDAKIASAYLNVPILANFYVVKGLAFKTGIQPGFLLSANDKIDGNKESVKESMKSFDVAVPVGVSYTFDFGLVVDARYNIGISRVNKTTATGVSNSFNNVFAVTVGWRF